MSSDVSPKRSLIRVKRRADQELTLSAKRCKFVATSRSAKDDDIYELLSRTSSAAEANGQLESDTDKDNNRSLKIYDYEDVFDKQKLNDIITCNGEPLEPVDNKPSDAYEYLYDIYVYEEDSGVDSEDPNQWRECHEEDEDENDENYAYNDYPDDSEVSDENIDFYSYRDNRKDSQTDLIRGLESSYIDGDYDVAEDIDGDTGLNDYYLKNGQLDDDEDVGLPDDEDD